MCGKAKKTLSKEQRRHQANQLRKNQREEVINKKRFHGAINCSPFLITIIPLNEQIDPRSAIEILKVADPDAIVNISPTGATHITYVFN